MYVAIAGKSAALGAIAPKIAAEIRATGRPAIVGSASRSLKAQFGVADALGAHFIVILGERDMAEGLYTVRDLQTHNEAKFPLADIGKFSLP